MKQILSHPKFWPIFLGGIASGLLGLLGAPWWIVWIILILVALLLKTTSPSKELNGISTKIPTHLAPDVLASYIRSSPKATLLLNPNGRVVLPSHSLAELFPHVETDQAFAQAFRSPALIKAVAVALSGKDVEPLIYKSTRHIGRIFETRFLRLFSPYDEILGAQIMIEFEDITLNETNETIRRDFIANASHELRTPLTTIQGGIETLSNFDDDQEAAKRFLPIMKSQADRMQRLIDDLMSLSKIEGQRPVAKDARFDISTTIRDVLGVYEAAPISVNIENLFGDKPEIAIGQADQITQVLINLIDNAIKHGKAKNIQILRAANSAKHPNMVGVTVKDFGKGIDPIHIPRLSERFYRAGAAQKTGTGLGLAIVKHILRRHDGELTIDSKIGEGSSFTFWLNL